MNDICVVLCGVQRDEEKMFEVVKDVMLKKKKEEIETVLETDEGRRVFSSSHGR